MSKQQEKWLLIVLGVFAFVYLLPKLKIAVPVSAPVGLRGASDITTYDWAD